MDTTAAVSDAPAEMPPKKVRMRKPSPEPAQTAESDPPPPPTVVVGAPSFAALVVLSGAHSGTNEWQSCPRCALRKKTWGLTGKQ